MKNSVRDLKKAFLYVMVIFVGVYAKASNDILLIDVNNVVPEIDYIRSFLKQEQAQGRELDTQLVIVPSEARIPMADRRQIQSLHLQFIDANATYFQEHCFPSDRKANANLDAKCEKILQVILDARIATNKLKKAGKNGFIPIEEIEQELAQVLKGPYQFSRVIISGHHSPDLTRGLLSGELYTGFTSEIAQSLLNSAASTEKVRTLIMLGCWTGRSEMMELAWGQVLPQAAFHSGYVETAPAKVNPANLLILDSILRNEKLIGASESEAELRQNYAKLKVDGRQLGVLVRGMYISPAGIKRLKSLQDRVERRDQ